MDRFKTGGGAGGSKAKLLLRATIARKEIVKAGDKRRNGEGILHG